MHIPQVMGGMHLHVRTWARTDVSQCSIPREWLTDWAEIWCVVRGQLALRFALLRGVVHLQLHVRTCVPLFHISRTAGRIALKFGMLLETNYISSCLGLGLMCTCARACSFSVSRERLDGLH